MKPDQRARSHWWKIRSVRARTTLVATLVVAVLLVGAVAALAGAVERNLTGRVLQQGEQEVAAVVRQLEAGVSPMEALENTTTAAESAVPTQVAILDHEGNPVVGSGFFDMSGVDEVSVEEIGVESLLGGESSGPAPAYEPRVVRVGETDLAIAQQAVQVDGELLLVVAASPLAEVVRSVGEIIRLSMIGVPLVVLIVAGVTWVATGRTLRPIENIRSEVEVLSSQTLHLRVPVPDTDDEVSRLAETMNHMLERLDTASTRQREFVSDASHELRSPVSSIRAQLEVALAHPTTAGWSEVADGVLSDTGRLERIIDNLLLLARLDEDSLPPAEIVDVATLTHAVASRVDHPDLSVTVEVADGLQIRGSPDQIESVIRNLVENAVRYAASKVTVAVSARDDTIIVTVDDDGPGIPPGDRQKIFDRFTRLEAARSRSDGGVGLGLAVVDRILRNHGGTVEATESPESGARFTVRIPEARVPDHVNRASSIEEGGTS
jgi:signal transduction histidine kinase